MSFGPHLRPQWLLNPGVTFLNHGSFGATPRVVLAAQRQWQDRLEQQPVQFMSHTGPAEVRRVAGLLAEVLGTAEENLVLVDNATTGINAVLRSFPWCPGDRVLVTSHTYGAIRKAATFIHQTQGVDLVELALPFPVAEPQAILAALEQALRTPYRLALLDHITSTTALILPLKAMIDCCHHYGVPVLVDGAHAPGMVEV
ncbi:MAG: aminotransferase class V-fold PLP-dependent enzyme, partial [Gloeomargaritaceae cyanobacterium C42_A2020_066]|nr:aminotransferase class V-fold PLP-dependent enzyme [Gloeomargaritaceae cyanobacterium C42_A2020_066]